MKKNLRTALFVAALSMVAITTAAFARGDGPRYAQDTQRPPAIQPDKHDPGVATGHDQTTTEVIVEPLAIGAKHGEPVSDPTRTSLGD